MCSCPVFPAPLIEETVFSPLYILASFAIDQVTIGACVYLWTFYPVPLIYISVFVPVPYCFDDHSFVQYSLKSRSLIPPAPFFFLKVALAIQCLLCFHTNFKIFCSNSVKNAIGNLIGIALNLQIALGSKIIFTVLILSIQEHGISLHLCHLLSLSSVSYSFLHTGLCLLRQVYS